MTTVFEEVAQQSRNIARKILSGTAETVLSAPPPGQKFPLEDTPELRAAVEETPVELLLPVLVQMSGGETEFLGRLTPHIKSVWEGGVDVPAPLAREFRDRLLAVLTTPAPTPPPLPEALLRRLMSTIVGEPIGDEFIPLLVEQMGFQPAGRFVPEPHKRPATGYRVAVIGAGMSGIVAGIKLAESGYNYRIFEKDTELGGVWWSNKYPGVGVDTPSHFYSYSFELNPDWPKYFSSGPVLMEYWKKIAEKYKVTDHIAFSTKVTACTWNAAEKRWILSYQRADGSAHEEAFDTVISATGLFTHPETPKLPGMENFKGETVHTAFWNPDIALRGKRVVQIGTGASGLQVGPNIAPDVERLTIFQRTPPWILVRPDRDYNAPTTEGFRWGLRHIPHLAQWMRFYTYWWASDGTHPLIMKDPDWPASDLSVNEIGERWGQMFMMGLNYKLQSRPDLLAKVTPDYPIMGKRILQENYWCDMLMRDNVELVTSGIDHITETGVLAKDGTHYPADVLIMATGFKMTKMMQHMNVTGRDGITLRDLWGEEDPRSYMGTMVPGFPNFFLINGPNCGATHGAGVNIYSEAQVNFILSCLDAMQVHNAHSIEVTQNAHDEYNTKIDEALAQTVWTHPKVTNYYLNSKGRNFISCPWRIVDFWHMMRAPKLEDMRVQ